MRRTDRISKPVAGPSTTFSRRRASLVVRARRVPDGRGDVAVAVVDVRAGDGCQCLNMETERRLEVRAEMDIPLGHKIALQDFREGDTIIKYDHDIGRVVAPIKKGAHVHVHNVKTKRW